MSPRRGWKASFVIVMMALLVSSALPPPALPSAAGAPAPIDLTDNAIKRFDFGTRSSPVMAGYTQVQGGLLYSRGAGYGWDVARTDFMNFRPPPELSPYVLQRSWVIARYGNDMTVDGVRSPDPMTFMVDLPEGEYRVRVTVGDLHYPRYSMNITAEGEQVAAELAAFHLVHRSVYQRDARGNWANYGKPLPYWFSTNVTDGTLDITFWGDDDLFWDRMDVENGTTPPHSYLSEMSTGTIKPGGGQPPFRFIGGPHTFNSVLGLEVYPALDNLITATPSGLMLDGAVTNLTVRAMVDKFNSATTQLELDGLGQTVREALYDHETGDLADYKAMEELLAHLQGDLVADLEPSHLDERVAGIGALLQRAPRDQALLELLNRTEQYEDALDFIFRRVETGKNHFYENVKAISILWDFQEGDPLYPSASMWRARALYMLDPHRWTSASGTGADILESLRSIDPGNPYVRMYRDTTSTSGVQWEEGQRIVTTTGKVDHWTLADPSSGFEDAPQWARWLREELYWLYDVTDWWVMNRQQPDGALGGGWSDDVEFIGLFGFDALISQGADDLSLLGAGRFVDGMLASGGVDLERGYSVALADAEHTAEWTGDSLPMMIAVDFGNPKWVEFSMKTGVLMRDLWMAETGLGHLHFRSNYLSATRIGGANTQEDAYINYRASLPARWVWWYNQDPEMQGLFVDWATAWVEDAMRTDDGKPRGVFPASVGWAGDELGGRDSPSWYQSNHPAGTVNYDWEPQMYRGYLEELVLLAYEATGNASLLTPFKLEAEIAQRYLDDPVPDPTPGGEAWAGMVLGQGAVDLWEGIKAQYGLEGAGGGSSEPNGYTKEDVIGMTRMGRRYIQHCLPLMTTEASATDRVAFVGIINPFMVYTGGGIGGALLSPKLTYTGLGRDFAACVMDARPSGARVLMYGFHDGVKDAGIMPWELEAHGVYGIKVGNDDDGDGEVDEPADYEGLFTWETKGQVVPMRLEGGSEKLVVITQMGAGSSASSLLPDLAATHEDVSVNSSSGALEVVVHNIGANASGDFTVSALDPARGDLGIGSVDVPSLEPPRDLLPSTLVVAIPLTQLPAGANVTILIEPASDVTEITTLNNRFTALVNVSGLRTNGPPAYIGPSTIVLEVEEDTPLPSPTKLRDLTDLFVDGDEGDELRYEVVLDGDDGEHVSLLAEDGALWLYDLEGDWNGNVTFRVSALDGGLDGEPGTPDDLSATSPDLALVVLPVNDPPEFVGDPGGYVYYVDEDQDLPEPLVLEDVTRLFVDVDGDPLLYTLYPLPRRTDGDEPEPATMLELVDGVLVLPELWANWSGNHTFYLVAYDLDTDGEPIDVGVSYAMVYPNTLVVRAVEDAPVVAEAIDDVEMYPTVLVTVNLSGAFRDGDGDALFFAVEDPQGEWSTILSVAQPSSDPRDPSFVISVLDEAFVGALNVTFVCYDRDPSSSSEQPRTARLVVEVVVHAMPPPANRPPHAPVIVEPEGLWGRPEEDITFDIETPYDPDGDILLVRWEFGDGRSSGWTASTSTTHVYGATGTFTVTAWVRDVEGLTNSSSVEVQVHHGPEPPPEEGDGDGEPLVRTAGLVLVISVIGVAILVALYVVSRREGSGPN